MIDNYHSGLREELWFVALKAIHIFWFLNFCFKKFQIDDLKNFQMNSSGNIRFGGQAWNPPSIFTVDTRVVFAIQSVHFLSSMPKAMEFSSILSKLQLLDRSHESTVLGILEKRPPYQGKRGSRVPWIFKIEIGCSGWQSIRKIHLNSANSQCFKIIKNVSFACTIIFEVGGQKNMDELLNCIYVCLQKWIQLYCQTLKTLIWMPKISKRNSLHSKSYKMGLFE